MAFRVRLVGSLENPSLQVSGEEQRLLTPQEYDLVGIDIGHLKRHFANGWAGPEPKDIYVNDSQLPWGDQSFGRMGLQQATIHRRAVSARIVTQETAPLVALGLPGRNNSSNKATIKLETDFSVTHTVGSSWNADARMGMSDEVSVEVGGEVYGAKVGYKKTISVESGYGQGGSTEDTEQIGSSAGVDVELMPHSASQAKLTGMKGTLVGEVLYETYATGHLWLDYGRRVWLVDRASRPDGQFFYFENIANVAQRKTDRQTLTFDLFANYNIDIEDIPLQ